MSGVPNRRQSPAEPLAVVSEDVVPYTALGAFVVDLGARIGALDQRSRKLIGAMLQWLSENPDDAPAIANQVMALEQVQRPMVRSAELHHAMTRPADGSSRASGGGA